MENNNSTNRKSHKSAKKRFMNFIEIITAPFNVLLKRQAITSTTKSEINPILVFCISLAIVLLLVLFYYRGVIFG